MKVGGNVFTLNTIKMHSLTDLIYTLEIMLDVVQVLRGHIWPEVI